MTKVFVYGTLKKGKPNNYLLQSSELLGESIVKGQLYYYGMEGSFPVAVLEEDGEIKGEVWLVDDKTLTNLDLLEGYPDWYSKSKINTEHGEAYIYHQYNNDKRFFHKVVNGDWQ